MKIFIVPEVYPYLMPASLSLRAFSVLSACAIVVAGALYAPVPPPGDRYQAWMRLAAGFLLALGSLTLSRAIGGTFLRQGGNGAFKALYWAGLASAGAGLSEALSAFYSMDVPLTIVLCTIAYSASGLVLLRFKKWGK